MTYKIMDIQGAGQEFANKLDSFGVRTTEDLLRPTKDPKSSGPLSEKTGISMGLLEKWARMAHVN